MTEDEQWTREMVLILHNGLWYVSVREHGRARVYQLESRPPRVTWRPCPPGSTIQPKP